MLLVHKLRESGPEIAFFFLIFLFIVNSFIYTRFCYFMEPNEGMV